MKTIGLFLLEFRRLLRKRLVWLVLLLSLLSPLTGLTLYKPAFANTMLSMYLANPAIAGGVISGLLFGALTVYELSRSKRNRMDILINAVISPMHIALIRLLALLLTGLFALILTMLVWLPITFAMVGSVTDLTNYSLAYLLFMGLAIPTAILAAAAAYQFTERADLSLVIFAAFAALSLTLWADNWQLCWLNPCVWALSDDFTNFRIFRSVAYMRLTWLTALGGVWILSWLCIRRYGKGVLGSLLCSCKGVYRPVIALLLIACSVTAYTAQPMVDHSNPDLNAMTFYELPYLEGVICSGRTARVYPNTALGTVTGRATYRFENSSGQAQRAAFGITPGYRVSSVKANGADTPFSLGDYQEYNEAMLEVTLPADKEVEILIEYSGFPQESSDMSTNQGYVEISNEYICLQNATLAPRLMNVLPDEGMYPAAIEITLPASMTLIPFCASEAEVIAEHDDGTVTWGYEDNGLGGIVYAGDYVREDIEAGGITVQFYYGRKHKEVMESAGAVEAIRSVVDYCTEHYGPLSFGSGTTLKLIQSRVSGGGYATDGASLLDEQDFTTANLGDDSKGAASGEVMIHELVHQWWGLSNMFDTANSTDPWSGEGLTVYTTYRIIKELYGEDYAKKYYVEQWQREVEDYYLNFYVRNPQYLNNLPEDKQLEVSNSLIHVRQYCEMPLKILKAEKLVGGEEAMDRILSDLFNRELDPTYPYLTYQNFLDACGLGEEELRLD